MLNSAIFFLPDELAGSAMMLMVLVAALCIIVGQCKLGGLLLVTALALPFLPVVGGAIASVAAEMLPLEVLYALSVLVPLALGFRLVQGLLGLLFGKNTAREASGILLADLIRWLARTFVLWPWRAVSGVLRVLIGRKG